MDEDHRPPAIFPAGLAIDARVRTFEELEAAAERWNLTTYQLERGTYRAIVQAVHTPRLQLGRTWRALRCFVEGRIPAGSLLISFPAAPRTAYCYRGHSVGDREAVVQHHSEPLEVAFSGPSDMVTLAVSERELHRRAEVLWHRPFPKPGRHGTVFFPQGYSSTVAGARFLAILEDHLPRAHTLAGGAPARRLENLLLDELMALLESPDTHRDVPGRTRLARKAEEYLRAHCREDISIFDLCAVTGATRRTLHLGFCELYGLPPMSYLKALRLSRVHRDLVTGPAAGPRVTETAMRWGFNHLGRFAADYRTFFGGCPSTERRSSPPVPQPARSRE